VLHRSVCPPPGPSWKAAVRLSLIWAEAAPFSSSFQPGGWRLDGHFVVKGPSDSLDGPGRFTGLQYRDKALQNRISQSSTIGGILAGKPAACRAYPWEPQE
jgi:hypothetical protein